MAQAGQQAHWVREAPGQQGGGRASGGGAQSPGSDQAGSTNPSGGHVATPHPKSTMGACPMGVECVTDKTHGGLAAPGGTMQLHRSSVQTAMSHGGDHWLAMALSEIPTGVRIMLDTGSGWRTHRVGHQWYGFDGTRYYAWLEGGPAPLGAPLGQNPAGVPSNCCQTNGGLYWIAGAIFALAAVVGVKGMKKKGKKTT